MANSNVTSEKPLRELSLVGLDERGKRDIRGVDAKLTLGLGRGLANLLHRPIDEVECRG